MPSLTVSGPPRIGAMVRQSFTAMTPAERTRVTAMYGAIAGLHLLGFFILFAFVVPRPVGLPGQLEPQHSRLRDRGHVHRHLAGRHAHLALRPDRGKVDRQAAARNARRHGPRAARC